MFIIRMILGWILSNLNRMTWPTPKVRPSRIQAELDQLTKSWTLYHFNGCPFCIKVRRHLRRQGLEILLKDASKNDTFKSELIQGGKQYQTPCLRIDQKENTIWMYESADIIEFISQTCSQAEAKS